ncbi:hypothetical protein ACM66B_002875 [Microbotryomycetes sp. NB124-2]
MANHRFTLSTATSSAAARRQKRARPAPPEPLLQRSQRLYKQLSYQTRSTIASLVAIYALWHIFARSGPAASLENQTRLVQLVPAMPARPHAVLTFADGTAQTLYPTDDGTSSQPLWSSPLEHVDLPLGAQLSLYSEQSLNQPVVNMLRGDTCTPSSCSEARYGRLGMNVTLGLDQLANAVPSDELQLAWPIGNRWRSDAITLVTQLSISRLARFERILANWDGPVSVSIYLTDETDVHALRSHLKSHAATERWQDVSLTVVKPDYTVSEQALLKRLRYPINKLRNIALKAAATSFVLVVDADFVPSPVMHEVLRTRAVPTIRHAHRASGSPTMLKTAIAVSAFTLTADHTGPFPSNTAELSDALNARPPGAQLTDRNAGHGPSMPSLLLATSPFASPSFTIPTRPWWSYSVCFEPQWEPYYMMHRASHPLYDERFSDQGGDKQSHALLLNALGFEFRVLRDVWFMHPPKSSGSGVRDSTSKVSISSAEPEVVDEVDERWPSARLVDPDQSLEHDGAHFNFHAQKDERRFRYFQDFLPEMSRAWGGDFRWPRGCDARTVARGRMFGKAGASAVFGL